MPGERSGWRVWRCGCWSPWVSGMRRWPLPNAGRGEARREMTEDEGLSVREAVQWCGDEITTREATRLRRLVEDNAAAGSEVDDKNSMPVTRSQG